MFLLNSWAFFRQQIWIADMKVWPNLVNWSLMKCKDFSAFIILIFARFFSSSILFYCTALRCGIQFLGNLAVGNQICKDDIWQQSFPNLFLWVLCAPYITHQITQCYLCLWRLAGTLFSGYVNPIMCEQAATQCWRWEGSVLCLYGTPHVSGWSQGWRAVQAAEHAGGTQGDGPLSDTTWPGLDVSVSLCWSAV